MPNVVKVQAGYKVQPLLAYLHQPAPPAAPAITFPKIDKEMVNDFLRVSRLRLAVRSAGAGGKKSAPSWPVSALAPTRLSTSKTSTQHKFGGVGYERR